MAMNEYTITRTHGDGSSTLMLGGLHPNAHSYRVYTKEFLLREMVTNLQPGELIYYVDGNPRVLGKYASRLRK